MFTLDGAINNYEIQLNHKENRKINTLLLYPKFTLLLSYHNLV